MHVSGLYCEGFVHANILDLIILKQNVIISSSCDMNHFSLQTYASPCCSHNVFQYKFTFSPNLYH